MLLVIAMLLTIGYVNAAASITVTISAQQSGSDVVTAPQDTTIQLVSSCSVTPTTPVTGTISYQYSPDGVTWSDKTTSTTYNNWDGTVKTTDFVLANSGSYIFYIDVVTEGPPLTLAPHNIILQLEPSTQSRHQPCCLKHHQ